MHGTRPLTGCLQGCYGACRGGAMQDPGYELPRMSIPRSWVNKGKRKGRGCSSPALLSASGLRLWGDPLGRRPQFKRRRHLLGGVGLDEREHTAIGGNEHIPSHNPIRGWPIGGGACAIRLDGIRAGQYLVASNMPIIVTRNVNLSLTVAVKLFIPCNGERHLVLPEDVNPIKGEQIRPVQRGLRALRPGGVLVIGKPCPDGQYSHDAYESQHHQ